jgi:hypothetical protein
MPWFYFDLMVDNHPRDQGGMILEDASLAQERADSLAQEINVPGQICRERVTTSELPTRTPKRSTALPLMRPRFGRSKLFRSDQLPSLIQIVASAHHSVQLLALCGPYRLPGWLADGAFQRNFRFRSRIIAGREGSAR